MAKRHSQKLLASALALTGLVAAAPGLDGSHGTYLANVGPAPLYFRRAPTTPAPKLPPLAMADKISAPSWETFQPTPQTNADASTDSARSGELEIPPDSFLPAGYWMSRHYDLTNEASATPTPPAMTTNVPPPAPAADTVPAVTPQMLVDYFKPAPSETNGPGVSVLVPMGFMPATPPAPPPSSATYKSQ